MCQKKLNALLNQKSSPQALTLPKEILTIVHLVELTVIVIEVEIPETMIGEIGIEKGKVAGIVTVTDFLEIGLEEIEVVVGDLGLLIGVGQTEKDQIEKEQIEKEQIETEETEQEGIHLGSRRKLLNVL